MKCFVAILLLAIVAVVMAVEKTEDPKKQGVVDAARDKRGLGHYSPYSYYSPYAAYGGYYPGYSGYSGYSGYYPGYYPGYRHYPYYNQYPYSHYY